MFSYNALLWFFFTENEFFFTKGRLIQISIIPILIDLTRRSYPALPALNPRFGVALDFATIAYPRSMAALLRA
jgi:hypothetical protein